MKTALTFLAVVVMVAGPGCSRKAEPEMPEDYYYNAAVDGPACRIKAPDKDTIEDELKHLTVDQTKVTGGTMSVAPVEADAASFGVPTPTAAGPVDPAAAIAAVKAQVGAALAAIKADDLDRACDLMYPPKARPAMRKLFALAVKDKAFEKLVQAKFGTSLLGLLAGPGAGPSDGMDVGGDVPDPEKWKKWSVDDFKFAVQGSKVMVTDADPDSEPRAWVWTAQGWRVEVPPEVAPMLSLSVGVAEAAGKVLDILTSEINSGAVTKDTIEARTKELAVKHIVPEAEKLFKAMFGEMMKGKGEGLKEGMAPAPAPPTGF